MAQLFDPISINNMNLSNRFVRSATWEGLATTDGAVTPRLIDIMVALAEGGIGLIITGYTFVSPEGQSSPGQLAIFDDRFQPGLRQMVGSVHGAGAKIALQIVHGGTFADPRLTNAEVIGPSDIEKDGKRTCRSMIKKEIENVISLFGKAAIRAKHCGFDAVQLHAAHGFLISQFLSPAFNRRTDEYGGSLSNRARLLLEVVQNVRKAVGRNYPLLVKLNSEDFLEGGLTREEAVQISVMLERASIDGIEFSGGTVASMESLTPPRPGRLTIPEKEVYYRDAALLYKKIVRIPLMLVGGIRSYGVASQVVQSGMADLVALSRPLIREPDLVKRWRDGDRRDPECISCNACFGPASEGKGLYCVIQDQ